MSFGIATGPIMSLPSWVGIGRDCPCEFVIELLEKKVSDITVPHVSVGKILDDSAIWSFTQEHVTFQP